MGFTVCSCRMILLWEREIGVKEDDEEKERKKGDSSKNVCGDDADRYAHHQAKRGLSFTSKP